MKSWLLAVALLAAGAAATPAFAVCDHCGTVAEVKVIKKESTTSYLVMVKMENGATRTFSYGTPTAYKVGDRVKIVDKKLVRQ